MKCKAISKKTGENCKANAMQGSELCYYHNEDPKHKEYRNENNRKRKPKPKVFFEKIQVDGIRDIPTVIVKLLNDILMDKLHPQKATALDKALNTLIKAYSEADNAEMLEQILEKLEQVENKQNSGHL